jgi:hypothetical protein
VALLATRLWPTTVLLAAFFVAYQQLENYVLAPRIMRRPVPFRKGRHGTRRPGAGDCDQVPCRHGGIPVCGAGYGPG